MKITLRRGRADDAEVCGRICHDAFEAIAAQHGFPKDFPSREVAIGVMHRILAHPDYYGVVAEVDGRVVGSNFLDQRGRIHGVGPITVDPDEQDGSAGRQLMQAVLDRAAACGAPGVRLLQDAYHNRSFALYTKLGFRARRTTAVLEGASVRAAPAGVEVRPATAADGDACNELYRAAHGHDRAGELAEATRNGAALLALRDGRITAYTTGVNVFGHSVAESNHDLKALIAATPTYFGGFHVPTNNDELLRWCFAHGLRVRKMMTLMTVGLYDEPATPWLPSILY